VRHGQGSRGEQWQTRRSCIFRVRALLFQVALGPDTKVWVNVDEDEQDGGGFATLQIGPVNSAFPRLVIFGGTRSGIPADLARIRWALEQGLQQVKAAQAERGEIET
jgi:hypothetical protein